MMRNTFVMFVLLNMLTACAGAITQSVVPTMTPLLPTPEPASSTPAVGATVAGTATPAGSEDFFTRMGITLLRPACSSLTPPQMEGPYYKAGSPESNFLFEEGMEGTRLVLAGYVLDQDCQPLPHARLDFWQADAKGEYDNDGYRLRGHQYTDAQGRYYLETILPGLYGSRPIEHIHVKVTPEGGQEITSQLYFPQQPVDGLTVTLEDRGDHQVGNFNFVVPR